MGLMQWTTSSHSRWTIWNERKSISVIGNWVSDLRDGCHNGLRLSDDLRQCPSALSIYLLGWMESSRLWWEMNLSESWSLTAGFIEEGEAGLRQYWHCQSKINKAPLEPISGTLMGNKALPFKVKGPIETSPPVLNSVRVSIAQCCMRAWLKRQCWNDNNSLIFNKVSLELLTFVISCSSF